MTLRGSPDGEGARSTPSQLVALSTSHLIFRATITRAQGESLFQIGSHPGSQHAWKFGTKNWD
jgi:hypothetical protein